MVQGVSPNVAAGYAQPTATVQGQPATRQVGIGANPEMDEFVKELETQHKKAVRKKNMIAGTTTAASLLALLGGTLLKGKWSRAISIAPLALTTLGFGILSLVRGNKTPDFRGMLEVMSQEAPPQA